MVLLKRFNDKIIHWKPYGTPPIGVPPEIRHCRFGRVIVNPIRMGVGVKNIGASLMDLRQRTNSVWGKKFVFIKHNSKNSGKAILPHN